MKENKFIKTLVFRILCTSVDIQFSSYNEINMYLILTVSNSHILL